MNHEFTRQKFMGPDCYEHILEKKVKI